ncbi:amidohydrolase family protein [Oceanobacillus halophilus]|uniref:Amidohydrolase-related domain-containing protein n=1 Tax=Oceanobacillus halophilus TaxID=930130 RepID=A0A495A7X4_9BACI|nr:amidohydrolase family protein [Oceanobacillus halophilus]RKQ35867.1 hypothetical protein D8M06_06345 [Oceanobacillus halophilus]
MENAYIVYAGKLVTVTEAGTIYNGAMVVQNGKISGIMDGSVARKLLPSFPVLDFSDYVVTPSLVDCHTHLMEFAPASLFPITKETQLNMGRSIMMNALMSGITAIGEQICGHPKSYFSIRDYKKAVQGLPLDISFAATSISIGLKDLAHFTSVTEAKPVQKDDLLNHRILFEMAAQSDYPGENLFLNATPANFTEDMVPRAGEIIYHEEELKEIVSIFHSQRKRIGVHVAGEKAIDMAIHSGVDVLHHAHGISDEQIDKASKLGLKIIATPLGGTHLEPNSPENILNLVQHGIETSIATDAYLPPYPGAEWLPFADHSLKGPEVFMEIAQPSMKKLKEHRYDENEILALITANPAKILGKEKENQFGRLRKRMDANFLVTEGVPGLEITDPEKIRNIFYQGKMVIDRS